MGVQTRRLEVGIEVDHRVRNLRVGEMKINRVICCNRTSEILQDLLCIFWAYIWLCQTELISPSLGPPPSLSHHLSFSLKDMRTCDTPKVLHSVGILHVGQAPSVSLQMGSSKGFSSVAQSYQKKKKVVSKKARVYLLLIPYCIQDNPVQLVHTQPE